MDNKELTQTIKNLDKEYPNGWRCGHPETDAITVLLVSALGNMLNAIFTQRKSGK